MRTNFLLKSVIALAIFFSSFLPAEAQKSTSMDDFIGVWEIQRKANINGDELILFRFMKIFYADGSFVNLNLNPQTSAITHKGKFLVKGDTYEESIVTQEKYMKIDSAQKFKYHFSDNKKALHMEGELAIKEGAKMPFRETWTKIEGK